MESDLINKYTNKFNEIYNRAFYGKCITTIEMECREKLINDLIEFLGYNLKDDLYYEYGGTDRVDYYFIKEICLEAKKLHQNSNDYMYDYQLDTAENRSQLYRYLKARHCKLGILSNGIEWQFYLADDWEGMANTWEPFRTVTMRSKNPFDFEFLECFRKDRYHKNNLPDIYTTFKESYGRRTT